MAKVCYVRVEDEPLDGSGKTYCGREYEERDNSEFRGPAHPVHVVNARGGPHDGDGNPAARDDGGWVVEIRSSVPDVDAEVEGDEG